MSSSATFTVHHGQLGTEDDLHEALGLDEGQRLIVVYSSDREIMLQREVGNSETSDSGLDVLALWDSLRGSLKPTVPWTPEWQAQAEERKQIATLRLDQVYADPSSGATEIKSAEREWELADDELDFGPFPTD